MGRSAYTITGKGRPFSHLPLIERILALQQFVRVARLLKGEDPRSSLTLTFVLRYWIPAFLKVLRL